MRSNVTKRWQSPLAELSLTPSQPAVPSLSAVLAVIGKLLCLIAALTSEAVSRKSAAMPTIKLRVEGDRVIIRQLCTLSHHSIGANDDRHQINCADREFLRSFARTNTQSALRYQRGSRRPPSKPPSSGLPPPIGRGARGRASLTARRRPWKSVWSKSPIAFCASSSLTISTNANPRGRPVARSVTTCTASTSPNCVHTNKYN